MDRKHRPEDLGSRHVAFNRQALEHRRPHEVPGSIAWDVRMPAVDDGSSPVSNRLVDEIFDPGAALSRDDRPHLHPVVKAVSGHAARRALADRRGEGVGRIADGDRE